MPTYNEDPAAIFGAACAIMRDLHARGAGEAFDLFLLSDTTRADVWLDEQALADAARADPEIGARIFYRHRGRNLRRKAGNIADWVERWGSAYPFMLVLDADSLMEASCIIELARRMEADDTLGILQTAPQLIGGATPLARVQQFASRVYGPVLTRGLRAWFGDAGNYWGHNAIIRTEAFAACGGLPELPGKPPFGGPHPEPRLRGGRLRAPRRLRRAHGRRPAGQLRARAARTSSSSPERDRRWCQGNLQHARLLSTAGLHPLSRLHLFMGVMSYLASPLWLLFLLAGMSLALHAYLVPPDYFLDRWSLFPDWPRIDPERAMALFGICMLVLFAPKLFGAAAFLRERASRGLRFTSFFGLVTEVILTALVAPIMMLVQSSSILQILTGRDSGWAAQARDADRVPWHLLWRFHRRHMLAGILLAVAAGAISWRLLAWMSPALLGLVLAVPVSAFMGNAAAGRRLARMGLLVTPEERAPPPLAAEAAAEADGAAGAQPPAGRARRPPRRSRRAGAPPRLARSPNRAARGRARRAARQRAAQALRRLRPGGSERPRDLCRHVLARRRSPASPPTGTSAPGATGERFVIGPRPPRQVRARCWMPTLQRGRVTSRREVFDEMTRIATSVQHHGTGRDGRCLDGLDAAGRRRDRRFRTPLPTWSTGSAPPW